MTASRVYGYDNVSYRFDSYLLYKIREKRMIILCCSSVHV
nr:MAG TPA: hypothetical protein [Caudoviricetes sp.]